MPATFKQKNAFKKVLKGSSIAKAMREVGYAKSTSTTTGKLTNTKGWQELVDKYLSEEDLMKVHKEGLGATKRQGVGGMMIGMGKEGIESMGHTEIEIPDYAVRHKYLETGYKIRGRLKENQNAETTQNIINIFGGDQLKRIAARVLDGNAKSAGAPDRLSDSDERAVRPELAS